MFYDFLAFFGSFVLAALLGPHIMAGRKRTGWLMAVVIAACVGYEILAFRMPFRAASTELLYALAGTLALGLILMAIPFENQANGRRSKPPVYVHRSVVLLFAFLPIISFTIESRVNQAQILAAKLDGVVSQAYRSHNHNVPSLVVAQADGSTVTMEGVDLPTWEQIVPGRSHLNKPAWSAYGELDGTRVRVVPWAKVFFLGPFPD